jgi:hypothetical protein
MAADASPEVVAQAKSLATSGGATNVTFEVGDLSRVSSSITVAINSRIRACIEVRVVSA